MKALQVNKENETALLQMCKGSYFFSHRGMPCRFLYIGIGGKIYEAKEREWILQGESGTYQMSDEEYRDLFGAHERTCGNCAFMMNRDRNRIGKCFFGRMVGAKKEACEKWEDEETVQLVMWIARNSDGSLYLYPQLPLVDEKAKDFTARGERIRLQDNLFKNIEYKNSPALVMIQEASITIKRVYAKEC